jgi:hypothetical protein
VEGDTRAFICGGKGRGWWPTGGTGELAVMVGEDGMTRCWAVCAVA